MLASYQEIRDRIYDLARKHGLRPDWIESTRNARYLLLYDHRQVVVARATVPVRHPSPSVLAELERQLAPIFGRDWMK